MSLEDVIHRLIDLSNAPSEEKAELHETVTPSFSEPSAETPTPVDTSTTGDAVSEGQ